MVALKNRCFEHVYSKRPKPKQFSCTLIKSLSMSQLYILFYYPFKVVSFYSDSKSQKFSTRHICCLLFLYNVGWASKFIL